MAKKVTNKYSDESVQEKFCELRRLLNSKEKQSHLRFGIHKEELDNFQMKLFEKMEPTKFTNRFLKWSLDDDIRLAQMHKLKVSASKMGEELGRTAVAIEQRLENLKHGTILNNLPEFFGELSNQLGIDEEILSEKINSIFIDKRFEYLRQEISNRCYKNKKIEFDILPKKKKRGRGRPKKSEEGITYDGFIMKPKKEPKNQKVKDDLLLDGKPKGKLRKQKTMNQFWLELGNRKSRLEREEKVDY